MIALGVVVLLLLFVLSFGLPLLELLLLIPAAVGIYRHARGRGGQLTMIVIVASVGFFGLRFLLPGVALRTVAIGSAAMEPTIGDHDRVLFDRTGIASVHVGAIVAFHAPKDAHLRLCGPSPHMIEPGGAACAMSESEYKRGYYIRRVVAGPGDVHLAAEQGGRSLSSTPEWSHRLSRSNLGVSDLTSSRIGGTVFRPDGSVLGLGIAGANRKGHVPRSPVQRRPPASAFGRVAAC
jgi:hypothetical protein